MNTLRPVCFCSLSRCTSTAQNTPHFQCMSSRETLCQYHICTTYAHSVGTLWEHSYSVCVCELCATEQSICSTGFQPPAAAALSGRVVSSPSAVFMATKKEAHIQVCTWLSWLSRFIKKRRAQRQTRSNASTASVRESPAGTMSSGCERCLELFCNAEHVCWWDQHSSARMTREILVAVCCRQWWASY